MIFPPLLNDEEEVEDEEHHRSFVGFSVFSLP